MGVNLPLLPTIRHIYRYYGAGVYPRQNIFTFWKRPRSVMPFQLNFMSKILKDLDHGYICIIDSKRAKTPCLIEFRGIKKRVGSAATEPTLLYLLPPYL